jgi:hypothetical protein
MKLSFFPWFSLLLIPFAYGQKITTFDVPGGTNTFPTGITQSGEIVGHFAPSGTNQLRGFLRKADGKFIVFDAAPNVATFPGAENLQGQIVGDFTFPPDYWVSHGFVRDAHGTTTLFSFPGTYTQTLPTGINSQGVIAGVWIGYDDSGQLSQSHGFLRKPDGTLVSIDVGGQDYPDTSIDAINSVGQAVGFYDNYNVAGQDGHGFLRNVDGSIAKIDVLNATSTFPIAINDKGQVAGDYDIPDLLVQRGFLREADGTITTFNVPGAVTNGNMITGIDSKGRVAGYYQDTNGVEHAFVRKTDGSFATFDAPGAKRTVTTAINSQGVMVGSFIDSQNKMHGFVLTQ